TDSMQKTIDETNRRRAKQISYNAEHNITPTTIIKSTEEIFKQTSILKIKKGYPQPYFENEEISLVADPVVAYMSKPQLEKAIAATKKKMVQAAKDMEFLDAAKLRDEMYALEKLLKEK
ncbi:MAG: UvrB/UvrC motif-containing protein, partial [Fimbriimonadaceae bacterium]|nr:UvrB/UvrC motif-containing protein [Chitinophagales bacterium]